MPTGRYLHSLNAALDVLEHLGRNRAPMSLAELTVAMGISKSSVHGLVANLEARQFIQRCSTGKFRLGLRVWELGLVSGESIELPKLAHKHLLNLTEISQESSQLSEYCAPGEVIYLDRVDSPNPVRAFIQVGRRAPAYCVATGRVLLAFQDEAEIDRVCQGPLEAYTPNTITDPLRLREELRKVRERGYALNHGEYRGEIVGVAAPVCDRDGKVVASLSVSGPKYRFDIEKARALAPDIVAAAETLSRELGMRATSKRPLQAPAKGEPI